jgi:hypothetical protein
MAKVEGCIHVSCEMKTPPRKNVQEECSTSDKNPRAFINPTATPVEVSLLFLEVRKAIVVVLVKVERRIGKDQMDRLIPYPLEYLQAVGIEEDAVRRG